MDLIFILFGVAGLVWFLAIERHLSVLVGSLMVILLGTTFGHPFFNFDIGPIPVTIDRVMLAWLIMASLVLWKLGRSEIKPLNRTDLFVILLIGLLATSTFMHDWQYKGMLPLTRLLFFNLMPVCFYFVVRHCRINTKDMRIFYILLAIFGMYFGLTAIFEQRLLYTFVFPKFILDPQYHEFLGRARGPFLNPVSCGIYLSVCMVAAVLLWPKAHPTGRVLLGLTVLICLTGAALTLTRSVWVGCAASFAIVCWFPMQNHIRGTMIVAGTILLLVGAITVGDRLNQFQRDKEVTAAEMAQSAKLRPMLAFVAVKMTKDKPVFGHGFGQYTKAKKPYHYANTNGMQLSRILPYMQHNVFLSYLTETGLVGFSLLCALLATLVFKSYSLWRTPTIPLEHRQFGLLGLAFFAVFFINGMFHDVSIIPHVNSMLYLLLGVAENLSSDRIAVAGQIIVDPELDEFDRSLAA